MAVEAIIFFGHQSKKCTINIDIGSGIDIDVGISKNVVDRCSTFVKALLVRKTVRHDAITSFELYSYRSLEGADL